MATLGVADAKARFSEMVERANRGEAVIVTKRGKPVARIVAADAERVPFDWKRLGALRSAGPEQEEGAGVFLRRLRDAARF